MYVESMKRWAIAVLLIGVASSAAADDREKQMLVSELMKVIDAPSLHRNVLANMMMVDEQKDRVLDRIDFRAATEETDSGILERTFTAAELREVIAFLKTTAGQKAVRAISEVSTASIPLMSVKASEAVAAVEQEDERARLEKYPWLQTLADMRTIATAAEAYATDTNHYPVAANLEELRKVLEPIYVRTLPTKDFWGNDYVWRATPDGQHYRVISAGADGQLSFDSEIFDANAQPKESPSLDDDIIYQDGTFIRYPKGADVEQQQ